MAMSCAELSGCIKAAFFPVLVTSVVLGALCVLGLSMLGVEAAKPMVKPLVALILNAFTVGLAMLSGQPQGGADAQ